MTTPCGIMVCVSRRTKVRYMEVERLAMEPKQIQCKVSYIRDQLCNQINDGWNLLGRCAREAGDDWPHHDVKTLPLAMTMEIVKYFGLEDISAWELSLAHAVDASPLEIAIDPEIATWLTTAFYEDDDDVPVEVLGSWPLPSCYLTASRVFGAAVDGVFVVPDRTDGILIIGIDCAGVLLPMIVHLDELCVFGYSATIDALLACTDTPVSDDLAERILTLLMALGQRMMIPSAPEVATEAPLAHRIDEVIWGQLLGR